MMIAIVVGIVHKYQCFTDFCSSNAYTWFAISSGSGCFVTVPNAGYGRF